MVNKKIDLNNLDKSSWNSFTFEQIATKISKTVQPIEAGVEVYVGLEHIDANDIHIRRRGVPSDVKGGKLRCSPGDVIFGKRRAYQRKAAVVDFEGICSAHAFVFHAILEVIDPKLFPFFLHSDQFMHRMIDISVGGLSPTINWGDLRHQQFLLPPKAQQAEIAELLWAVDEVIEKHIESDHKIDLLTKSYSKAHYFQKHENVAKLKEVGKWVSGGTPSRGNSKYWSGDIPWVSPKDMKSENIENSIEHISQDAVNDGAKLLPEKSILVVVRGLILAHSFPVGLTKREVAFNQDIRAVIPSEKFVPEYVLFFLHAIKNRVLSLTTTTTHGTRRLATDTFSEISIPCPSYKDQKDFIDSVFIQKAAKEHNLESLERTRLLRKSLIEQVF